MSPAAPPELSAACSASPRDPRPPKSDAIFPAAAGAAPIMNGRGHHGQDAGSQKHLITEVVQQARVHAAARQHEGKFPDLADAHGRHQAYPQRVPQKQHRGQRRKGLEQQQRKGQQENRTHMGEGEIHIQQHADGNEEQAGEDHLERQNAFHHAQAVFRLRQQQPGHECPQREGKPQPGRADGNGEAQAERADKQQFPAAGAHNHEHEPGQHMLGQNPAAAQYRHGARAGKQQFRRAAFCCPESSGTSSIMGTMARS